MTSSPAALLFWDIDGTLLTTGRAGIYAWEGAALAMTGSRVDLGRMKTSGLTDYNIAAAILDDLGLASDDAPVHRLVQEYEKRLPECLSLRPGTVLAGVREILEHLRRDHPFIRYRLLTGDTRAGARAKLTHYGLAEFFPGDGGFADDTSDRTSIAQRAWDQANRLSPLPTNRVYVIGDTPHDIRCGRHLGVRAIAVATGDYSVEELEAHRPWRTLPRLPRPSVFVSLLGDDTS